MLIQSSGDYAAERKKPVYYDIHCHILPGIDDGSPDTETSAKMLDMQKTTGVERIIATPHFYLSENTVSRFIEKRSFAFEKLRPELTARGMELICGAEVLYTESLADEDLSKLCIEGSRYMLIELPYIRLSKRFIDSFRSFAGSIYPDIVLILAHAERYLNFTDEDDIYEIINNTDILVQVNCGSLKRFASHSGFVYELLKYDRVHFLGTDCHNTTSRRPNMDTAEKVIRKKFSPHRFDELMYNAGKLFSGEIL